MNAKRRYDHLRFRANEDRRQRVYIEEWAAAAAAATPPGEPVRLLGTPFPPALAAHYDRVSDRLIPRRCSNGRCTVYWDPARREVHYSFGPAGCCDE